MTTWVSANYRTGQIVTKQSFFDDWRYQKFLFLLSLLGRLRYDSRIMHSSNKLLIDFIEKSTNSYPDVRPIDHHSGPCVPGQIRLFMNADGYFYPCERVSEESQVMRIGHVDEGFNLDKVRVLLNIGKLTEQECKNCFALRGCTICAMNADDGTALSSEKKTRQCALTRNAFLEMLKDACTLHEHGLKADKIRLIMSV